MATLPFDIGDVVYLRESAALGFLEAMRINGAVYTQGRWLYSIAVREAPLLSESSVSTKRSMVNNAILYYTADEFVTHCQALELVRANLASALERIVSQQDVYCPSDVTG